MRGEVAGDAGAFNEERLASGRISTGGGFAIPVDFPKGFGDLSTSGELCAFESEERFSQVRLVRFAGSDREGDFAFAENGNDLGIDAFVVEKEEPGGGRARDGFVGARDGFLQSIKLCLMGAPDFGIPPPVRHPIDANRRTEIVKIDGAFRVEELPVLGSSGHASLGQFPDPFGALPNSKDGSQGGSELFGCRAFGEGGKLIVGSVPGEKDGRGLADEGIAMGCESGYRIRDRSLGRVEKLEKAGEKFWVIAFGCSGGDVLPGDGGEFFRVSGRGAPCEGGDSSFALGERGDPFDRRGIAMGGREED